MGHFHETIRGTGRTRAEARSDAMGQFQMEHGIYHDIRDWEGERLIERKPPERMVVARYEMWPVQGPYASGKRERVAIMESRPDPSAPQSQWLEVWEFDVHYHA